MRVSVVQLFAVSVLSLSGLITTLTLASCGGMPHGASGAACARGTVSTYIGTTCAQEQTVFHWSSYRCTSIPTSICGALGTNGSNIHMLLDPRGPHTILVGDTTLWRVTAGQSVDVVITGSVFGARSNGNWPHFQGMRGQTGDGSEDNKTAVGCGENCLDVRHGVSDVPCSPSTTGVNCMDEPTVSPYVPDIATFNPAPPDNPYPLTLEIKLNGGTHGTASLHSVGIHVSDLP